MQKIIEIINNDPYDITYLGIGSANVRNTNLPSDRQQYPPFLEEIYNKTNKKIRLINIDLKFEEPKYLTKYFNNLKDNSVNTYSDNSVNTYSINSVNTYSDRLDIIYYIGEFLFDKIMLDKINKIIMDQNKILILCDFTGRGLHDIELYFYNYYKNCEYHIKYSQLICYDFIYDKENTCVTNLLKNFPIIKDNKIIKINFGDTKYFLKMFEENKEYTILFQKKYIIEIQKFIELNLYIYRNLINKNLLEDVIIKKQISIFKTTDVYNIEEIKNIFFEKINEQFYIIQKIFGSSKIINIQNEIIENFNIYDGYNLYNKLMVIVNYLITYVDHTLVNRANIN
jgi:hypothetical protein